MRQTMEDDVVDAVYHRRAAAKDGRKFSRKPIISEIELKSSLQKTKAWALDYSLDGFGIVLDRTSTVGQGEIIEITMKAPEIRTFGEVVWLRREGGLLRAGVRNIGKLKGNLKDFRLAEILIGLQRGSNTGVLTIESGSVMKKVYLSKGDMIFASSNLHADRLGDILLSEGAITRAQYDASVEEMKRTGQRQGTALVKLGHLTPGGLVKAVIHQVEEIIRSIFLLEKGSFSFEMTLPKDEVITLKLSTANLIYYGMRGIACTDRVKDMLPDMKSVVSLTSHPLDLFQDIRLDPAGSRLISRADGKTPLADILAESGLEASDALNAMNALISIRLIEVNHDSRPGRAIPKALLRMIFGNEERKEMDPETRQVIEEMHRSYAEMGYYGVLGLNEKSRPGEIKKAYYQAAKKFHPDAHHYAADDALKGKLNDIFTYLHQAYRTLADPEKRKEYDYWQKFKPSAVREQKEQARERFETGRVYFRQGNYRMAARLFGEAVSLDGTVPDYHYHHGISLGKDGSYKEAARVLESARRLDPRNADCLAELGFAFLHLGFAGRARNCFESALKISEKHGRAAEGMRQFRRG